MRTEDAVISYLEDKADLSPRTLEHYRHALGVLAAQCPEFPEDRAPIRRALNGAPTVWVKDAWWRAWSAFFHWCCEEFELDRNPMRRVHRPPRPDVEMRSLSPEELARLLSIAHSHRDKGVLTLGLDSGVRASEFGRICPLDIGQDTVRLQGKGNRRLSVPISPETRALLSVLAQGKRPQDPLFTGRGGRPLTRYGVYHVVRSCMERAGIAGPKRGSHCLRHSLGRSYIAQGGNPFSLQRVMRHRKITTTQKYVSLAMQEVISEHARYSPLRAARLGAQALLWQQEAAVSPAQSSGGEAP